MSESQWKICARIAINTYNAGCSNPPNEEYEKGWSEACHEVMKRIELMFCKRPGGSNAEGTSGGLPD